MNEGCWLVLEWKNGEINRFWFETNQEAERFRRQQFLTPSGRLIRNLVRLAIIPDPDRNRVGS